MTKSLFVGAVFWAIGGEAVAVGIDGTLSARVAFRTNRYHTPLRQRLPVAARASAGNPYSLFKVSPRDPHWRFSFAIEIAKVAAVLPLCENTVVCWSPEWSPSPLV